MMVYGLCPFLHECHKICPRAELVTPEAWSRVCWSPLAILAPDWLASASPGSYWLRPAPQGSLGGGRGQEDSGGRSEATIGRETRP